MYGECHKCKEQKICNSTQQNESIVTWPQWRTGKVNRKQKTGEMKLLNITVKQNISDTVDNLIHTFHEQLW